MMASFIIITASAGLCITILACVSTKHNRARAFVASPCSPVASPKYDPSINHQPARSGFRRTLSQHQHGALFLVASPSVHPASNDPRVEVRTTQRVTIDLPLGLIIEEMDSSDPSFGVAIIGIIEGNTAHHNTGVFSKIKSRGGIMESGSDNCVCIRDKIMAVNDTPCHDRGFDDVINLISSTQSEKVTLELGRLQESTIVSYYDGVCISAKPGESYGFLAEKCAIGIDYECRTGNCQTCMRLLEFPDKERDLSPTTEGRGTLYKRTIFNCIGKVPRGYQWLHVLDPYQKESDI